MTVDDLMANKNCQSLHELSQEIGVSLVTLWKWRKKGIPPRTQAIFEVQSKGELKADLTGLEA